MFIHPFCNTAYFSSLFLPHPNLFWDLLLLSTWKWANVFPEIVKCLFNSQQEEDLHEIITKIKSKRAELDEGQAQMADLKGSYEKAEQEYKQHKEGINTIAEEADSVKVILKERPSVETLCFSVA